MGRIYTRAGLGLEVGEPLVHHGVFGTGMFQTIYAAPQVWCRCSALARVVAPGAVGAAARTRVQPGVLAASQNPLLLLPLAMLGDHLGIAWMVAGQASPPERQRAGGRARLIAAMHVAQPVERGWARYKTRFETILIPEAFHDLCSAWRRRAGDLLGRREVGLWSEDGRRPREAARGPAAGDGEHRWFVRIDPGWASHDVRFYGDRWCKTTSRPSARTTAAAGA
jgi:hypothetical protein